MDNFNSLAPGTKLKQYRIKSILGQGGFGITYLAEDEDLNLKVAIKECYPGMFVSRQGSTVIPTTVTGETDFGWALEKFRLEAMTLAKFKHPGIVQVLQILNDENNTAYMVLEFVEGQSLEDWLNDQDAPPTETQLQSLSEPLLNALYAVHKNSYTHRDIAPDNIYIRADGNPVLLDFGAAKQDLGQHSKTMNLVVKDGYSPPEQYYTEGNQGPWTDIYAFGATLYRAIAGDKPVDAMARLDAVNNDRADPIKKLSELQPANFSPSFLAAIDAALEPKVKDRPQDIQIWQNMLFPNGGSLRDDGTRVVTSELIKPGQKQSGGKGKVLVGLSLAASLLTAVAGGTYYYFNTQKKPVNIASPHTAPMEETVLARKTEPAPKPTVGSFSRSKPESPKNGKWQYSFGSTKMDVGRAIAALPNGGFVLAGKTEIPGQGNDQAWLLSLSKRGERQWDRKFGEENTDFFNGVAVADDGSIVAVGQSLTNNDGWDALAVRLSAAGEILWKQRFSHGKHDIASAVTIGTDGDIYLAGSTESKGNGRKDGWIVRLDRNGNEIWNKTYGLAWDDELTAIARSADGRLVVAGSRQEYGNIQPNFWAFSINDDGIAKEIKQGFNTGKTDKLNALAPLPDGSVIMAGDMNGAGTHSSNSIIFKLGSSGGFQGVPKIIKGKQEDHIASIDTYPDGSLIIAGYTRLPDTDMTGSWIMKLSADLKTVWKKYIQTERQNEAFGVVHQADGGAVIVGKNETQGANMTDLWVVKFDKNGKIAVN